MKIRSFGRDKKKPRIEIIPMIDTMFFLLVFFMIATLTMTVMRGIPVNLPKSGSGEKGPARNATVTVAKDGKIYFGKDEVAPGSLEGLLKNEFARDPNLLVILNADEDIAHGKVVGLIDEIRLSGVTRLAIATKPGQ